MPLFTSPTVGASNGTWGTELNVCLAMVNDEFKRKTADESVTSDTTLQNDNDLVVPVVASSVYRVEWDLRTDGALAGDFKYAFTGPSGATMVWQSRGNLAADTANTAPIPVDVTAIGTTVTHGTIAAGTVSRVCGSGILVVSTTAGNLQLQWAQGTSSATATKALTHSWLRASRVA